MTLFTTYLSAVKEVSGNLRNAHVYYVMRDRGNNEVAPSKELLKDYKEGTMDWEDYANLYIVQIRSDDKALAWIDRVAEEALIDDVLLVCFEKNQCLCHRLLLANQMAFRHPEINYAGDLHPLELSLVPEKKQG